MQEDDVFIEEELLLTSTCKNGFREEKNIGAQSIRISINENQLITVKSFSSSCFRIRWRKEICQFVDLATQKIST